MVCGRRRKPSNSGNQSAEPRYIARYIEGVAPGGRPVHRPPRIGQPLDSLAQIPPITVNPAAGGTAAPAAIPSTATGRSARWITAAKRSRINAFVALAQRLEVYFEEVITAIELGISNALIEGINAKIRLINARGYGHHSAQTLSSMIYLCLGGLHPQLPTKT